MKVSVLDLQRRHWTILSHLPHSFLKNVRLVYVLGYAGTDVLLVTNDRKLFFYGFSLNFESSCTDFSKIKEIEQFSQKHIKGFACNSRASKTYNNTNLFVKLYLNNGEVYSLDPRDDIISISLIGGLPKTVVKVACGESHCIALTLDAEVYAWGDNTYGQTASGLTIRSVNEPRKALFDFIADNVVEVDCGSQFSIVLTRKHRVYGWGRNTDGLLGENKEERYMPIIRELSAFHDLNIQQIVCGSHHILALNKNGDLFSTGSDAAGQLGLDTEQAYGVGQLLSPRFKEIAASVDSSVGKTLDGEVMVWGNICGEALCSPYKTPCRSINEAFALYHLGGMYKPIEVATENESVAETIRNSFGNPETSDFKIIVEENEICVHKSILALRSKYFERMFNKKNWLEGKKSFIKMNENYVAMKAFLKYLYTDDLSNVDLSVLLDVAVIAEKYCESYLVSLCLQQFESGLNDSNVAELYQLTLDLCLFNFNDLCVNYASRCIKAVVTSKGYDSWDAETFKQFYKNEKIKSALCD